MKFQNIFLVITSLITTSYQIGAADNTRCMKSTKYECKNPDSRCCEFKVVNEWGFVLIEDEHNGLYCTTIKTRKEVINIGGENMVQWGSICNKEQAVPLLSEEILAAIAAAQATNIVWAAASAYAIMGAHYL